MTRTTMADRDDYSDTTYFDTDRHSSSVNFTEDFILPEQFFAPVQFQHQYRGEVALLYAILGDAIRCFLGEGWGRWRDRDQTAQEAASWLFVDDEEWPFSFVNVCAHLGYDPTYVRRSLNRWQKSAAIRKMTSACALPQALCLEDSSLAGARGRLPRFRKHCKPVRQLRGKE
jgi:hypothetical protein